MEQTGISLTDTVDTSALLKVHDIYFPAVYRFAYVRLNDQAAAEHVANQAFKHLVAALQEGSQLEDLLPGWLFSAADALSNHEYANRYSPETLPMEPLPADDPATLPVDSLDGISLREAIRGLPSEEQQVVALRFAAGLPLQAVAQAMGHTEDAVRQIQGRAMAALAGLLQTQAAH